MKRIGIHKNITMLVFIGAMMLITSTLKAQYPVILDQSWGYDPLPTKTHTINLPPGIELGDILLLFISETYEGSSTWSNQPPGWAAIAFGSCNVTFPEGSSWPNWHQCGHVYYTLASASEGSSFTYTTQVNVISSYIIYRIQKGTCSGVYGIPMWDEIGIGQQDRGLSDSPDPLPLDAPNNTNYYNLWLATCFTEGSSGTVISPPAGFTSMAQTYSGISEVPSTAIANLDYYGLSLDPGPFSLSTTQYWVSGLICLQGHQENHCNNPYRQTIYTDGDFSICEGGQGPRLWMEDSETGVVYQMFREETAITEPIAGTGESIDFGHQSIAGVYSVYATRTSCGSRVKWYVSQVYVYPYPVDRIVSTETSSVCAGTGTNITVAESETGTVYTLKNNFGYPVWNSWGYGNGGTLTLPTGDLTQTTTFSVFASRNNGECVLKMTNTPTVTVNTLPPITGTSSVCMGSTTQLLVSGTPAENDPWISVNTGVATVNNSGLVTGVAEGIVDIIYTDNNGCSQTVAISVNALPESPTAGDIAATYDGLVHTGTAEAPPGSTIVWFDAASEGNVTVAPSGTSVGTYIAWAESVNSTTGCKSASRKQVTVTISKAPLTVKANDATKYCGQMNPAFSVTYSGFVNGENELVLNGTLTISSDADEDSGIGTYPITPSGLTSVNYEIKFEAGVLTINSLSIDASSSSNPVPVGTSEITLRATVFDGLFFIPGVKVWFSVENGNNITTNYPAVSTDGSGVATLTLPGLASIIDVFKVTAVAGSNCGATATSIAYLAIYDPSGGFVTGGGWINSPAGAYLLNPLVAGKANFGFISKYKKGSNVPDGNTEFQFNEGNLNFSSSSYDLGSLVIAGYKAIYKGVGSINGTGNYGFMVSVVDGNITGGGGYDKFRIKIWDKTNDAVVYDNNLGTDENDVATTVLGGGSVVIHKADKNITRSIQMAEFGLKVYPNPFTDHIYFDIQLKTNSKVLLEIYDVTGTKLSTAFNNDVEAYESYLVEYIPNKIYSGILVYRLTIDGKLVYTGKLIHL